MSKGKKKPVVKESTPKLRTEDEERDFWAEHDVVDYFDWDKSVQGSFPALKPSTKTISLRLPQALLEEIKTLANERDVPYQSLLKIFLAERVARERQRGPGQPNMSQVPEPR
jgi:predicted DNA binding CopG/RHH family protein